MQDNQRMRPSAWTEPNADPSKGPQLDPIKAGSSKVSVLTYGETIPRAPSQPETTEPATTAAETKPTDDDDGEMSSIAVLAIHILIIIQSYVYLFLLKTFV